MASVDINWRVQADAFGWFTTIESGFLLFFLKARLIDVFESLLLQFDSFVVNIQQRSDFNFTHGCDIAEKKPPPCEFTFHPKSKPSCGIRECTYFPINN